MAGYKEIKGFQVQTRTADPGPTEAQPGDFYYNSTTGQFKTVNLGGAPTGSWSSGGNLNNGIVGNAGFGTYTAAVSAGGASPPGFTTHARVEEYNGSAWSNVNAFPTAADSVGSCGPQTSGMIFGGQRPPNTNATYEYDGTNWTAGGNLNTTRRDLTGAGTQTAGLAAIGAVDPPMSSEAEQYDGSSWTTVAEANTGRRSATGGGTSTSALIYGGYSTNYLASTESWDGTSWTEVADLSTIKGLAGGGGASNTSQLMYGGYGGPGGSTRYANTESWNGTSWTEVADLSAAKNTKFGLVSAPTANQLYAGGHTPAGNFGTTTEEWAEQDFQIKTVTQS